MGRPSTYTEELGRAICKAVSTSTDSLAQICARNPGFPVRETVYSWRIDHPTFGNMYALAKGMQADLLAEEVLSIADDSSRDTIIDAEGNERCDHEWVHRSRLKIDARKWIACKLMPKVYGDKQTVDTNITLNHEDTLKDLA